MLTRAVKQSLFYLATLICLTTLTVLAGDKVKFDGVVLSSENDRILVDDLNGNEYRVLLTEETKLEEKTSNFLREARTYNRSDLVRGLRVTVKGRRDDSGEIVAKAIKFKHIDLKVASTVEERASELDENLGRMRSEVDRMDGQVDELASTSERMRRDARRTEERLKEVSDGLDQTKVRVDENSSRVGYMEERFDTLDDYRILNQMTVNFGPGESMLSAEAKKQLDELAVSTTGVAGVLVQVTGYASSDGPADFNRRLSDMRAQAVIRYLAEEHSFPLRRFVQPHGFGESMAVADNATTAGRKANRRAEIKVLVNEAMSKRTADGLALNN